MIVCRFLCMRKRERERVHGCVWVCAHGKERARGSMCLCGFLHRVNESVCI